MRKFFIVLLSATLLVGLSSCKKESTSTPEGTDATTEQPAASEPAPVPAATTAEQAPEGAVEQATAVAGKSASELLKEFENYVVAYADANNNKTKDVKKYMELAQQSTEWVSKISSINRADLKPAEVKKLEKLLNDLTNINKVN